jgi:DMSO/TMAO reductase YedYZ molybdopterin-dependent catalytic subunit
VKRGTLATLLVGLGLVLAAILLYVRPWDASSSDWSIDWELALIGKDGRELVVGFDEIRQMPSYEGRGGCFSSVGVVSGPFDVRGVPIADLCELVGGVGDSDIVFVSAVDGYSAVFDSAQLDGDFDTFDPDTLAPVLHGHMELVLMYELDGQPLDHEFGGPVRVAIAGPDDVLTEGHYWVKWVSRIEVMSIN